MLSTMCLSQNKEISADILPDIDPVSMQMIRILLRCWTNDHRKGGLQGTQQSQVSP